MPARASSDGVFPLPAGSAEPAGAGRQGGKRYKPISLPPARRSGRLVIRIAPRDVGLFRFLLEAHDNLALFTVLDSRAALLKLLFSPHQRGDVLDALGAMQATVSFQVEAWPVDSRLAISPIGNT